MSAPAMAAHPEQNANVRPLPWRRMIWVTWRQHRFALTGVAVLLGGLALYVWLVGRQLHDAYAASACHPAGSPVCSVLASSFQSMHVQPSNGFVWQPLPALIGAFLGAPLLAREVETGTFRYAWTQGFGRRRWTLAKLVLLATTGTAAAGAFSVLLSWYYQPYVAARDQGRFLTALSPPASGLFDLRGVAFAAWTLAAFAIGALAGVHIRRLCPRLLPPLPRTRGSPSRRDVPAPALPNRADYQERRRARHRAGPRPVVDQGRPIRVWPGSHQPPRAHLPPPPPGVGRGNFSKSDFIGQCLSRHGYTQLTSYQPGSRFWSFQLIEGSWLLALSLLLIGASLWLVRRRTA
jgi:hypothetical protein